VLLAALGSYLVRHVSRNSWRMRLVVDPCRARACAALALNSNLATPSLRWLRARTARPPSAGSLSSASSPPLSAQFLPRLSGAVDGGGAGVGAGGATADGGAMTPPRR